MTRKRWDDKRRRFAYTLAFAVTPDSNVIPALCRDGATLHS